MTTPEQPQTPHQAQRPLSAQVAARVREEPPRLALADYPGVRDIDYAAGLVQLESGNTMSIAAFFGRHAVQTSLEV